MTPEKFTFSVQGSSTEPYMVIFEKSNNRIKAYCSCPAGKNGQPCKHRLAILAGDTRNLLGNSSANALIVNSWLPGSNIEEALSILAEAEHNYEKAKQGLSKAKKLLAKAMQD